MENQEETLDPVNQAFNEYLGVMKVGETKMIGMEEFRNLMHAIRSDFNPAKENSGTIGGGMGDYEYSRGVDDSDVTIKRVG